MADSGGKVLLETLTKDEYDSINEEIRVKIESCINVTLEDYITAKAVFESKKSSNDDKIKSLCNELAIVQKERSDFANKCEAFKDELSEVQLKLETANIDIEKYQNAVKKLEGESVEYRRLRDNAIDERDEAVKMIERRNIELQRLNEDITSLSSQLHAAISAKCEAMSNSDEVHSLKLALEYKEKRLDQEKVLLNQQIQSLNEDLAKHTADMTNCRRDSTNNLIMLRTQLAEKTEELKVAAESNKQLSQTNLALNKRIETLSKKLLGQSVSESAMTENYRQEISAQTKLAELYKGLSEDAASKNEELTNTVKELQRLLQEASVQCGEMETKLLEKQEEFETILGKKNLCIQELKKELDHANELIVAAKQENLENAIEAVSPAAAATSRLLKSGLTLTQIYSQYASVSEQLLLEKEENRKLNLYITTILEELEQKAPILKKQREDYDLAMTTVDNLSVRLEEMEAEAGIRAQTSLESQERVAYLSRENKRLQENISDLARQVCYLLKEVEESRGGSVQMTTPPQLLRADVNTSADIISKNLVTFADIQELQVANQKLLAVVRELSDKQEKAELHQDSEAVGQLEHKLKLAEQQIVQFRENENHHFNAMELVKGQREMYRTLYQQQVAGKPNISTKMEVEESPTSVQMSAKTPEKKPVSGELVKIQELEKKLKEKEQELTVLKKEYDSYRTERNTNEKMLNETLEKCRDDMRKNSITMSELLAKAEYSEEKFKTLQGNAVAYKAQIAALEQKINIYVMTIAKHEQSFVHLNDEAVNANNKLSRAEVTLDNLKREYQLLKESEGRLVKEKELMLREKQLHSSLMSSIESIKVSVDRSELEGKIRLEKRLDETQKECCALRRRLQEEQDRFREKVDVLERSTQLARSRLDEEKGLSAKIRQELNETRDHLKQSKAQIDQLNAKVRTTAHKVVPDPETGMKCMSAHLYNLIDNLSLPECTQKYFESPEKRAMFLEQQLSEKDGEILCLKEQITATKQNAQEYYEISQSVEKQLNEINAVFKKYKDETEPKLAAAAAKELEMKTLITDLESRVASLSSAHKESATSLGGKLKSNQEELTSATAELSTLKEELKQVHAELDASQRACRSAEEKYAHEITIHAEHIMSLTKVKEELDNVSARVNNLEAERNRAVEVLSIEQEGFRNREEAMRGEMDSLNDRIKELNMQNDLLHEQLQALGLKMAVVQSQADSSSSSLDTSLAEEDMRNSDQLLKVMKYLRTEKNIAMTQLEGLKAENLRLKAQAELVGKQLEEAREMLAAERDKNDVSLITTAKHDELLRKVETLNALTDSNRTLREERDRLVTRVAQLEQEAERIESEVVAPTKEQITKLTNQVELLTTENTALRGDGNRWRQRANALIEKANKNSPEDFKRLTLEKETLAKQLLNEKEETKKVIAQEKSKLEEQMKKLTQTHKDEVTNLQQTLQKLRQELTESKTGCEKKAEELAKMTHEYNAQEAALTDIRNKELQIRQIAKKYKTQYQELVKSNEEEKKKEAAVAEISAEAQERFREEGRREAESSQSDKLKELTDQITALQAESAALRKENEALRVSSADKEERAKVLLKNARNRILLLTEDKKNLTKEINENVARLEAADRNKEMDAKLRRVEKEKADLTAEKDRLAREVEMLTQRINLMQRQLDKQQGSKPSTSSGLTEKSNVDPPTANIKPMAGPATSGSKQQATQHSVTVTPWRGGGGETPFASIRPMSLQSRTVAVLPTTNQSNQGQAVLVPPQVHTSTGVEALSSSPTSSHTDYMPATSSAIVVIRPSTIPPTQQPPPSAESTQDMEAECGEGSQAQGGMQSPGAPQSVPSTQALSIALVLPQPTIQTQAQVQLANAENSSVVSASNQEQAMEQSVVSASNHMPTASGDQGFVSGSSGQQQCSTVPAYYRQVEMEEPIQSVASSHTTGTGEQSVVASSESLAEPSGSATVVSSHSPAEQSVAAVAASSHANSSNTVTTTQSGPGSKRPRDNSTPAEDEGAKSAPAAKRSRVVMGVAGTSATEAGEMLLRADGLEVEYQVPTSSQRDQEDDIILVDSEEEEEEEDEEGLPDDGVIEDGQDFEEEADNEEGYEMESYGRDDENNLLDRMAMTSYEVGEGPDIDEENITDQDNNEVEIIDDSNEVPNQSESSSCGAVEVVGGVETGGEATSSGQGRGVAGGSGRGDANVSSNQATPGSFTRRASATHIPPLNRQQQLLLPQGYEDVGDDSIVPSTPTLFVPRRTDGFGEAVSSPHVPSGRFTFTDNNPPTTRAGVAQVASEGMDDTRMDLSQLEDSGTGRSVPSTPLQVSPQDPVAGEVGQSNDCSEEQSHNHSEIINNNTIPAITITMTNPNEMQEMPPPSDIELEVNEGVEDGDNEDRDDGGEVLEEPELVIMDLPEESGDGVSSEGEKSAAVVDEEEGREAEASEAGSSVTLRRSGTARRSARSSNLRGRARAPPTRIVWEEDPPTSPRGGFRGRGLIPAPRGSMVEQLRSVFRGRATRQRRTMFHPHYQPRF